MQARIKKILTGGAQKKKMVTPFYFELRNFEYINYKFILLVA